MSVATFFLFVGLTIASALAPGPNVLLVISFSLKQGFAPAAKAVCGIFFANLVYMTLAALGLIALLRASQLLFTVVRFIGAAYLIYIGARLLIASFKSRQAQVTASTLQSTPLLQGLLTHLSNPKGILYWSALLPQFLTQAGSMSAQILYLGAVAIAIDTAVLMSYAVVGSSARNAIQNSSFAIWIDRVAGGLFIAVGIWLGTLRIDAKS